MTLSVFDIDINRDDNVVIEVDFSALAVQFSDQSAKVLVADFSLVVDLLCCHRRRGSRCCCPRNRLLLVEQGKQVLQLTIKSKSVREFTKHVLDLIFFKCVDLLRSVHVDVSDEVLVDIDIRVNVSLGRSKNNLSSAAAGATACFLGNKLKEELAVRSTRRPRSRHLWRGDSLCCTCRSRASRFHRGRCFASCSARSCRCLHCCC